MRKAHLSYLLDPVEHFAFELLSFDERDAHMMSGVLVSPAGEYPIIEGVPRILTGALRVELLQRHTDFFNTYSDRLSEKLRKEWEDAIALSSSVDDHFTTHQKNTADSFAFEWNNIYQENNYETDNYLHFLGEYLAPQDFKDKVIVDIWCGSWRFTKVAAEFGPTVAFGVDLSEAVTFAFDLTRDIENICIVQSDIYHLPFLHNVDIGYSIWVLHHLPDPKGGFLAIARNIIRLGGKMLIWVYARKGNARAIYFYEPLRAITKRMNKRVLLQLCHVFGSAVHLINLVDLGLQKIGLSKIARKMPFHYYTNFPYNMKWNDAFDVLATPKSNYYYTENIIEWFKGADLGNIQAHYLEEAGLTVIGEQVK